MSGPQYALGVVLTLAMGVSLVVAGVVARRLLAPAWSGAVAVLGDVVVAITLLLVIGEVLGLFGQFRRWPVVAACVAVGIAVPLASARRQRAREDVLVTPAGARGAGMRSLDDGGSGDAGARPVAQGRSASDLARRVLPAVALVAVALLAAQWSAHVVHTYQRGFVDGDSIWYHLPFSARFLQTGWTSRLHFTNADALVTFFPANSEMLNAALLLPFHRDVLIPVVNLGWLALALLAGWCVGRHFGAAVVGLCGTALVASLPLVASTQAGTARNDVMAVALVLTAVTFLLESEWQTGPVVLAGAAAGLALGTKLNLIAPVGLLTLGVLVVAPRVHPLRTRLAWLLALVPTGSFWYLRNLAHTGNPLPWLSLHVGPLHLRADPRLADDVKNSTLADHLGDDGLWSHVLHPGLHASFGPLWLLVLALVAVGVVAALVWRGTAMRATVRMVGAVAAVAAVVYVFTPNSATNGGRFGTPTLLRLMFLLNLRYALPAVALGLVLVAAVPAMRRPELALVAAAVMTVVVAVDLVPRDMQRVDFAWRLTHAEVVIGLAVGAAVLVAGLVLASWRDPRPRGVVAVTAVVVLAGAVAGWPVQRHYAANRYRTPTVEVPVGSAFPWARTVRGARIGLTGDVLQYPLYGPDLSNHVQYVGVRGPRGAFDDALSCTSWQRLLRDGRYRYVVFTRSAFDPVGSVTGRQLRWTTALRGTTVVADEPTTSIVRVDGTPGPAACR